VLDPHEAAKSIPLNLEEPVRMAERSRVATERNSLEMWEHFYQYKRMFCTALQFKLPRTQELWVPAKCSPVPAFNSNSQQRGSETGRAT
jgi:hypothetical protein